jgi:hypothetical protein
MKRKDILLPGLALVGGAAGFGLRRWLWSTGYQPETQLFFSGHPAIYLVPALTAALVVLFLLLIRGGKRLSTPRAAFRCPNTGYMTLMTISALCFLLGGLLCLIQGMRQLALWRAVPAYYPLSYPLALILCALLSLVSGPATLLVGRMAYRKRFTPNASLLVLFPPMAALTWLFAAHLEHGTDPILLHYGFSLAAIALLLLAHYEIAAFFHERPHPRRMLFCALMGIFLGITALGDGLSPFQLALTAAFVLSALAYAWALLRNTFGPPWPRRLVEDPTIPDETDSTDPLIP